MGDPRNGRGTPQTSPAGRKDHANTSTKGITQKPAAPQGKRDTEVLAERIAKRKAKGKPPPKQEATSDAKPQDWRDVLPVHPAADLFEPLDEDDLRAVADDIKKNGLKQPIVFIKTPEEWPGHALLDGRNRLDAMFKAGVARVVPSGEKYDDGKFSMVDMLQLPDGAMIYAPDDVDPYAYVISANIHRRHLTPEKKRDLIAKLLKADPSKSNRSIGEMVKADHHKVAAVRKAGEATGEISPVQKTTGKDGKARPAKVAKPKGSPLPPPVAPKPVDTVAPAQTDIETAIAAAPAPALPAAPPAAPADEPQTDDEDNATPAIIFAEGEWHTTEAMAPKIGVPAAQIDAVLGAVAPSRVTLDLVTLNPRVTLERRRYSRGWQTRIYQHDDTVSIAEFAEKLRPIVDELDALGRCAPGCVSNAGVLGVAGQLRNLLARDWGAPKIPHKRNAARAELRKKYGVVRTKYGVAS